METKYSIIELKVQNHPGVMSHITGLFSRRGFNLEGIMCSPIEDGSKSIMYLLVEQSIKSDQMIKQLEKLYDVIEVNFRDDYDPSVFRRLPELMNTRKYKERIAI